MEHEFAGVGATAVLDTLPLRPAGPILHFAIVETAALQTFLLKQDRMLARDRLPGSIASDAAHQAPTRFANRLCTWWGDG